MSRADIVFTNGVVVTQDPAFGSAEAVAIDGEKIVAVGTSAEIEAYIGADTRVVDLEGMTLAPGFVDAHTHILTDNTVAEGQALAMENGITTVGEAFIDQSRLDNLVEASRSGQLRVRTNLYLVRTDNCGSDLGRWYEAYPPDEQLAERVRVAGVKVFADGGSCGPLAVSEPFRDGVPIGEPFASQEAMQDYIGDADSAGYQLAIHAIGDKAIRQVMDAYEAVVGPGGAATLRHRIDHNAFLTDDIVGRYDELGLTAVVFGWLNTCNIDDSFTEFWWQYGDDPSRPIEANPNTVFAWHGDDPYIGPVSPLIEMFGFVDRSEFRDGEICRASDRLREKAIGVEKAWELMTTGSAYALRMEDEVGSITPGKYADLLILSDNPLTVDVDGLLEIEVEMTMIGGVVEHCLVGACESLAVPEAEAPVGSGVCIEPPSGMIHWWTADEGPADRVGGVEAGILGATSIGSGAVGSGFRLRGSSIALPAQPDLRGGFSFEGWARFDDGTGWFQTIFNNNQVFLRKNNDEEGNGLAVFIKLADGSVEPRAQADSPVPAEVWTHFAATWDGATLILYVNGVEAGRSQRAGELTTETVEARFGSGEQEGSTGNEMSGSLDELTIYSRAIDASEVAAIWGAGSAGKCR